MEYEIGGVSVKELVKKFGSPIYVYDADYIKGQFAKLTNAFNGINLKIHYAMKANENIAILDVLKDLGAGIDAVSPYEIDRALNLGFDSNDIVFTPSCAPVDEINYSMVTGINVHIGALEYFPMLREKLRGKNIGLRINPGVDIGGNQKIATAHQDSKFGIPIVFLDKVKEYQKLYGFNVVGIHLHTGSNVNDVSDLKKSIDHLFSFASNFNNLKYLDIGSGLKIKYKDSDKEIDIDDYAAYIKIKLNELGENIEIKIEPGKYLVGNAGYLVTKVNIVKQGFKKKFVGVNSGFHHLIRPMYYGAYHEIVNISNLDGVEETYDVVGQLCEEDTFAIDRAINKVSEGDILLFKSAGAYSYSMAMEYNLRKKPNQILIEGSEVSLLE